MTFPMPLEGSVPLHLGKKPLQAPGLCSLGFPPMELDTGPRLAIRVLGVPVTLEADLGGAMPHNEAEHKLELQVVTLNLSLPLACHLAEESCFMIGP